MSETAASLWQLLRDDSLVRRGAWISLGIVWLAAAWADLRMLIFIPPSQARSGCSCVGARRSPDDDWLSAPKSGLSARSQTPGASTSAAVVGSPERSGGPRSGTDDGPLRGLPSRRPTGRPCGAA